MTLAVIVAHAGASSLPEAFKSWTGHDYPDLAPWNDTDPPVLVVEGRHGMLLAYQLGLRLVEMGRGYDILAFLHDDTIIREPGWAVRVLKEFVDPTVGVVGFGGALVHGSHDLYKVPYRLQNLGRSLYLSNVDDAEVHGERFEEACDVAVLDGFALVVRRELLSRAGGWPVAEGALGPGGYIAYDYWLCAIAHRLGYRCRVVGVRCQHLGGRTSVALNRRAEGAEYERAHRWIFEQFRDVLPFDARRVR